MTKSSTKKYRAVIFIGGDLKQSYAKIKAEIEAMKLGEDVLLLGDGNEKLSSIFNAAEKGKLKEMLSADVIGIVYGHGSKDTIDDLPHSEVTQASSELFNIKNQINLSCHAGSGHKKDKEEEKKYNKKTFIPWQPALANMKP